ncbi:DUF6300 family protein [Streptomyces sp. NPDC060006]|uniref:DUF6300 family protein n=1 Tax=unclassified Streptomyces TaxID=2593676 RepID=UPI0036B505C1
MRSTGDEDKEDKPARQPCSRCGGDLMLHWHDPWGTGVWMELCPACDADRPAARAFIDWRLNPDRDTTILPKLFEDGERPCTPRAGTRLPKPQRSRPRQILKSIASPELGCCDDH